VIVRGASGHARAFRGRQWFNGRLKRVVPSGSGRVQRNTCCSRPTMNGHRLTISRRRLTVLVAMLNMSWSYSRTTASFMFNVAGLTDFVDGEIARRFAR